MKISFQTLGCKLNFAESSAIANSFRKAGHEVVSRKGSADVLVINTCAVTDVAEKKCRAAIRQARKHNPNAIVAVVGCFAQLSADELSLMDEVDIVIGNEDKHTLPEVVGNLLSEGRKRVLNSNILKAKEFVPGYSLNDRTRTFLKIQDGCNYRCTYCTIPKARGRSRSSTIKEVLEQIEVIENMGIKEIVLTGVNIGDFGRPVGENFTQLLYAISKAESKSRIRIGSVEPELLNDEIIKLVAETPSLMPHFHLPLQSGSDKVLEGMKRKYGTSLFKDRVSKIKELLPQACIAADVIVGFPGESDEDFDDTYNFIASLPISYLHVFTYSERKKTPALDINPKVSPGKKRERSKILHTLSEEKKSAFYKSNIGKEGKVLFETDNNNGMMHGFTENYIRVAHSYNQLLTNTISSVLLKEGVNGEIICTILEK